MPVIAGLLLALVLALAGQFLSELVGTRMMGMAKSPVSPIMMAILLGIAVRNLLPLPALVEPGIRFGLVRVLRFGIVLLGIRLSLGEAGAIGIKSLPVIVVTMGAALLLVVYLAKRLGLSGRLGTLIAVGTSICGATAIVATAPAINAKDNEVSYSVACVTLFGVAAMLAYPFLGHFVFGGDTFSAGLFLGTAVHETAQVAGAGLVYQQFYGAPEALDVATVTKLVRNLSMVLVIPLMCVLYHRQHTDGCESPPRWYTMIPVFILGFAAMSLLRTVGDMGTQPFGILEADQWRAFVGHTKDFAELCLAVAMACVGLGTRLNELVAIGFKPLGVGLFSALLVGVVSLTLVSLLY